MLRNNEVEQINIAMDRLIAGEINTNSFRDLLRLRSENNVHIIFKELADFSQHNPKDRGPSFDFMKNFVKNTLDHINGSGIYLSSNWLYHTQREVTNSLILSLGRQNIFNAKKINKLKNREYEIMLNIIKVLDDSNFKYSDELIKEITLHHIENNELQILELRIHLYKYARTTSLSNNRGRFTMTFDGPICVSFLIAHKQSYSPSEISYWRVRSNN